MSFKVCTLTGFHSAVVQEPTPADCESLNRNWDSCGAPFHSQRLLARGKDAKQMNAGDGASRDRKTWTTPFKAFGCRIGFPFLHPISLNTVVHCFMDKADQVPWRSVAFLPSLYHMYGAKMAEKPHCAMDILLTCDTLEGILPLDQIRGHGFCLEAVFPKFAGALNRTVRRLCVD